MTRHQQAFTLVELLTVVALLALMAVIAVPSFIHEQHYQEVGSAVKRAGTIAAAIDSARAMGVVGNYDGSLRNFITAQAWNVNDYMSSLNSNIEVLGVNQRDLYRVKVGPYSVQVSFSQTGSEYSTFQFPSSQRTVVLQDVAGVQQEVVTWTTGPALTDGISAAHLTNHYMNYED
ncbi:prepilin-type N-terminal cleavage/methylation domain-containing protein [Ketobacter sp.]|uniref:prepilin-type N-terminal cleavage/methylation domain-containing protein n=1 Tax=Ketobacter sp. TaxID=2083498 RepID=UPI000F21F70E|nr:prepilin-type N-terminal cleavage/methylation domain-containing protein [Ketobacter sp.]RLU00526.1 MAG: prepilin-type N-terminal cleavage/methylation domain-containing protein [Ketobacter sp.]